MQSGFGSLQQYVTSSQLRQRGFREHLCVLGLSAPELAPRPMSAPVLTLSISTLETAPSQRALQRSATRCLPNQLCGQGAPGDPSSRQPMELALPSLLDRVRDRVINIQLHLTLDSTDLILHACEVALFLGLLGYIFRLRYTMKKELHLLRQQRWASLVRAALDAHALNIQKQLTHHAQAWRTRLGQRHAQAVRQLKPAAPSVEEKPTALPVEEDPGECPEPPPSTWRPTGKARGSAAAAAPLVLGTASPPAALLPQKPVPPPKKVSLQVPCPRCNSFLSQKAARRGGWFWGCPLWPECRGTRPLAEGQAIRDGLRPASFPPC